MPLRLLLNLFSNEQYIAVIDRRETVGPGRVSCRGFVEEQPGSQVILSLNQGCIAGSVLIPGCGSFQIQPAVAGWERIGQIDGSKIPPCGVAGQAGFVSGGISAVVLAGAASSEGSSGREGSGPALAPTNVVIDLLVVYTTAARDGAGGTDGMIALIDAAVAEANGAFENSQVQARLQLVHQAEIDYRETGNIADDLDNLEEDDAEGTSDEGPIRGVHELRRQYRADVVSMITETTGGPLGLANQLHELDVEFSEKAFSVVQREYVNAYYVLAHEIGHNLGCQHDRATSTGDGAFDYSHAHLFMVGDLHYHTIMAYQPGLPTPYFSNPDVLFQGVPTGVPEGATNSANNAKTINLTASTVAMFSSVLRTGTPPQIQLVAPTNGATLFSGSILLSASVISGNSLGVKVEFLINDVKIGEQDDPPFRFIWTNTVPGIYAVRAVAKDDSGWETTTPVATVTLTPPPPELDAAASHLVADGTFQLRARGSIGQGFRIEASQDLSSWVPVFTNSFTSDVFDFIDTDGTNYSTRFYRIRAVP